VPSTVTVMCAVVLAGILQGIERPGSVYSITLLWCHLMVLQYVAASFHLPSVSTANFNTVQYPKPHKQCEIPTIPTVVISKVLLPQSNLMAASVHSNSRFFSNVSACLPKYNNRNVTKYSVLFSRSHHMLLTISDLPKMSNVNIHYILITQYLTSMC
jgi:hypothetical protein